MWLPCGPPIGEGRRVSGWPTVAPTLSDGVVTLRAHRPGDVDAVWAQCQDPEIQRWTSVPLPYERPNAEYFVTVALPAGWEAPLGTKGFAIEALDGGRPRFAGTVELRPDGTTGAEVGFGLAPWARGRGVMAQALRAAMTWAFRSAAIEVVTWRAEVGNWASRRVAWACGFQIEGSVRGLLETRGVRCDGWIGTLRRGEEMQPARPWPESPEIHGERVHLRPWQDQDVPRAVESCSDPLAQRWLPHLPSPYGPADAEAFLLRTRTRQAEGAVLGWSLADPADDRSLGSLHIFGLDRTGNEAEIGYLLHPDARGRGLMTEAVRLAVRHAVLPVADGGLGLPRLSLRVATLNAASRRVAEAAGFRLLGVQRAVDPQPEGEPDDLACYDLLAAEVTAEVTA
jgi:RimJ/RimL family protein N-acetyltransferase